MWVHPAARSLLRFLAFTFERRRPPALPARAYRALALDGLGRVERLVLLEAVSASGLRLRAGSEVLLDHTGSIVLATLEDAIESDGLVFAAGRPVRFSAGAPIAGTLVAPGRHMDVSLPEGAEVDLRPGCGPALHALSACVHADSPPWRRPSVEWTARPPGKWELGAVACAAGQVVAFQGGEVSLAVPSREALIDGIPCAAGAPVVWRRGARRYLARATLARDARAGGSPVLWKGETELFLREDGSVEEGTLARGTVIDGVPCAAGERVALQPQGRLGRAVLAADARFEGHLFRGGTEIAFAGGARDFMRGTLAEPARIGDVPCAAGPVALHFRRRFVVAHAILSEPAKIDGFACSAGGELAFGPEGRLLRFTPAEDVTIDGFPCRGGSEVALEVPEGGRDRYLLRFTLARPMRLGKSAALEVPEGSRISRDLWDDDALYEIELGRACSVGGLDLPAGSTLRVERRRLEIRLSAPSRIAAGVLPAGSTAVVRPRRGLERAKLGDGVLLDGVLYPPGSMLVFRPSGRVRASAPAAPIRIALEPARAASPYRAGGPGRDVEVCGAPFLDFPTLSFHASGLLASAVLAAPAELDGEQVPALSEVRFDRQGRLRGWSPARL